MIPRRYPEPDVGMVNRGGRVFEKPAGQGGHNDGVCRSHLGVALPKHVAVRLPGQDYGPPDAQHGQQLIDETGCSHGGKHQERFVLVRQHQCVDEVFSPLHKTSLRVHYPFGASGRAGAENEQSEGILAEGVSFWGIIRLKAHEMGIIRAPGGLPCREDNSLNLRERRLRQGRKQRMVRHESFWTGL